jgi:acetolactate synthase regulatory subunit
MKHSLQIQLRSTEGAALRTIGLFERRGFRIETLQLTEPAGDGRSLSVSVTSDRAIELLQRQLDRLHDVLWVELKQPASQWANGQMRT